MVRLAAMFWPQCHGAAGRNVTAARPSSSGGGKRVRMNVVLWIIQGLLVIVFGFSALVKGTQSKARALALGMTGVANLPTPVMRFTAFCELLAIIGLVGPQATESRHPYVAGGGRAGHHHDPCCPHPPTVGRAADGGRKPHPARAVCNRRCRSLAGQLLTVACLQLIFEKWSPTTRIRRELVLLVTGFGRSDGAPRASNRVSESEEIRAEGWLGPRKCSPCRRRSAFVLLGDQASPGKRGERVPPR